MATCSITLLSQPLKCKNVSIQSKLFVTSIHLLSHAFAVDCVVCTIQVNPGAQDVAEQDGLEAESVWLVHKGGFSSAQRQQCSGDGDSGPVSIKLDSGELLHVDDEDVEKVSDGSCLF